MSLFVLLKKDLQLKAYKIQLLQELTKTDFIKRVEFAQVKFYLGTLKTSFLVSRPTFFHLKSLVNKQKCHYWFSQNSQLRNQRPLHSPKDQWAAISSKGIICPNFLRQ